MQRTVEILLVIGILVNLVKGADLILRPHQQKRLQEKFESLALWLDYTRPLVFYKQARHDIRRSLFTLSPFILGCFIVTTAYVLGGYPLWGTISIFAITIWLIIRFVKTIAEYPDLLEETSEYRGWFAVQLLRHFLLGGISIAIGYFGVFPMLKPGTDEMGNLEIAIRVTLNLVFLMYTTGVGGPSLAVALVSLFLFLSEVVLTVLRAVVWRIVEYNKGAFAALILIATILLGMTELYLKFDSHSLTSLTAPVHTSPSPAGISPGRSPQP